MISLSDFKKKQVAVIFFNDGEKMSFRNDNLIVTDKDNNIKLQCSCYRLFLIYVVGHCSISSGLIQRAKKFGFFIALLTPSFRLYSIIGDYKDSNTLLKQNQYNYTDLEIGKRITENKIQNQAETLKIVRNKSDAQREAISLLNEYSLRIKECENLNEVMAFEGLSAKLYFKNHFNNILWQGRQPRVKRDIVNSSLDIGYTLLFTFIEAILSSYGFDLYRGVLHRQFYMRKSLVCDMVEPFRPLIDMQIKKSINLKQIQDKDFIVRNNQYVLKWEKSSEYVRFLLSPILNNKEYIFEYIQSFYRAFMKNKSADDFPVFDIWRVYGYNKL